MTAEEKTMKMEKLEWYKEILTLEPTSKMFLSLARLLAEIGHAENNAEYMNEAFEVLRKGLDIHPDFIEARLFLVELLNTCGCRSQCGAEVARLASLFLSYPDFWDAWREYAITENESSDFTVALGFMSAIMRNKSLSIVQVLEAGLNALKADKTINFNNGELSFAENKNQVAEDSVSFEQEEVVAEPLVEENQLAETIQEEQTEEISFEQDQEAECSCQESIEEQEPASFEEKTSDDISLADVLPKSHVENYANFVEQQSTRQVNTKQALAELIKDANITVEPIEKSPFRTKGMADLLAEQGDYKGAVDIYRELIAKGEGNVSELEERVADLIALCPKLDEQIDTSNLFAIDDLVDTSFGLLAKETVSTLESTVSTLESKGLGDLPIVDYSENNSSLESVSENEQEENIEVAEVSVSFENEELMEEVNTNALLETEELSSDEEMLSFEHEENVAEEQIEAEFTENKEEVSTEELVAEESVSFDNESNDEITIEDMAMQNQDKIDFEENLNSEEIADFDDTAMLASDGMIIDNDEKEFSSNDLNAETSEESANTDVADLLAKLAERLEIRAN